MRSVRWRPSNFAYGPRIPAKCADRDKGGSQDDERGDGKMYTTYRISNGSTVHERQCLPSNGVQGLEDISVLIEVSVNDPSQHWTKHCVYDDVRAIQKCLRN